MSVRERIHFIRLLEKMSGQKAYCEKLGLQDISAFRIMEKREDKCFLKKGGD